MQTDLRSSMHQIHRSHASLGPTALRPCSGTAHRATLPSRGARQQCRAAQLQTEASPSPEGDDDSFMCFAPDFDEHPSTGSLLPDWLAAPGGGVPAGTGRPDRAGFQLWQQQLGIQGRLLELVGPASINSVTFWYWRRGLRGMDPFWARPWPCGLALADYIMRYPELVRGKRVIELGAGVGAPGIMAALAGAAEVYITDREPLSLDCAALSARACGLQATVLGPGAPGGGAAATAAALVAQNGSQARSSSGSNSSSSGGSSGSSAAAANEPQCAAALSTTSHAIRSTPQGQQAGSAGAAAQELGPQVKCMLLDWSQPVPEGLGSFDLIIATDVLYEHTAVPMLASVVGQLLPKGQGQGQGAPPTSGTIRKAPSELDPQVRAVSASPASGGQKAAGQAQLAPPGDSQGMLLLAEYPDRYPTNLRYFKELLQAAPLNMPLSGIREEVVKLPHFVNEMLDIEMDCQDPSIKTDFLTFTRT